MVSGNQHLPYFICHPLNTVYSYLMVQDGCWRSGSHNPMAVSRKEERGYVLSLSGYVSFLFTLIGQNLIMQPHSSLGEGEGWSLYSSGPCAQLKLECFITKDEEENGSTAVILKGFKDGNISHIAQTRYKTGHWFHCQGSLVLQCSSSAHTAVLWVTLRAPFLNFPGPALLICKREATLPIP